MDILHRISRRIDALPAGEQWVVSAQDLWISRADFQSISVFLSRESQKGGFSVSAPVERGASVTVTKH